MSHTILMPIMNFMTRYYHRSEHHSRFFLFHSPLKLISFLLFITGAVIVISCDEDPTFIGKDILPSSDYVSVKSADTFNIISYTQYDYPIKTESQTEPFVGNYYDPYFGTTRCEFVSQIRLENEWIDGAYDVDSVKLILRIVTLKGSTDIFKQLRITEISDKLYVDSAYYSNTPVDTTEFGVSVGIPPLRNDTINIAQINLPSSFGEYLIRDQDKIFYSSTGEDFRDFFKGLYIRIPSASDTDPLLLGLDINAASSLGDYSDYIKVYMHDREDNTYYSFRFLLDPIKDNACYARIERDFSTASPDKGFSDKINQPVIDTLSYLQGLNGVYTKIIIPGLESLKNDPLRSRTAINKASLYMPVSYDDVYFTYATVPDQLYIRYYNTSGVKQMIQDYYIDDYHEYFNGKLDTAKDEYKFNISNFIQDYFNDKDGILKPELEVFQSSSEIKNSIMKANDSKSPVRLEMTITNF